MIVVNVSAPVEVCIKVIVVVVVEAVEDDASELFTVVADVPAGEVMTGEVGSVVEVPAGVLAP